MKSHRSGITLIEVLIAVSLLSLLALGALIAMRIGFNTMDKTDAHLEQNRRVANARKIIENEIAGFLYTTAEWRPQPLEIQVIPFQQWEGQSMRFVTSYSLQEAWRGRPQIAALQVIPGDKGAGVRLIVNEIPYTGAAQAGEQVSGIVADQITGIQTTLFAPILPGPSSFVLADRLAFCRFSYLEMRMEPPYRVWRPDWIDAQHLPLGVRMEMAPLGTGKAASNAAELHVTTVSTPLFVNRGLSTRYADVF